MFLLLWYPTSLNGNQYTSWGLYFSWEAAEFWAHSRALTCKSIYDQGLILEVCIIITLKGCPNFGYCWFQVTLNKIMSLTFPVAIFAPFSVDLEIPSLRAVSWASACVCCALHVAWCGADPLTWENWTALQDTQLGRVWVQSVIVHTCGFKVRSSGWGNVGVERNGGGGGKALLRGDKCSSVGRGGARILFCQDLIIAQCWAIW